MYQFEADALTTACDYEVATHFLSPLLISAAI